MDRVTRAEPACLTELDDGGVRLHMDVHYPPPATSPFSDGAAAGPGGETLRWRRTLYREGADGLRGAAGARPGR